MLSHQGENYELMISPFLEFLRFFFNAIKIDAVIITDYDHYIINITKNNEK